MTDSNKKWCVLIFTGLSTVNTNIFEETNIRWGGGKKTPDEYRST